jgi:hypothetical protein
MFIYVLTKIQMHTYTYIKITYFKYIKIILHHKQEALIAEIQR